MTQRTVDPAAGPDSTFRRATSATYLAFILAGVGLASWASRIPQIRDRLGLEPSQLGLMLLAIAAGSMIALPSSGMIVNRLGSRRTVAVASIINGCSVVIIAVGYLIGVLPVVAGLLLFGFSMGAWDVAMNVQGALVERRLGRAIMPRFHAGFSVGTVVGALVGAAMVGLGVPVTLHLGAVGILIGVGVPLGVRRFLSDATEEQPTEGSSRARTLAAWREPRTILVGIFVLAFAFAEGTAIDWVSIALIDGYGTSPATGTLGFAVFLAAMTAGRWFGPDLLDRYGRVVVLRVMGAVSACGVLLFVFAEATPLAFVGAVLWGAGLSLGFPVGMSAGADEPEMAAARVSVIATIGYGAFLAGPPAVGFLGDHHTVLRALVVVAVMLAVAVALAGWTRPPDQRRTSRPPM